MITIGKKNRLSVTRENQSGYYLQCEDGDEVFLPGSQAPINMRTGDDVVVFVYMDTKGSPIATTEIPVAEVGDFAYLRVADLTDFGAFMEWGIEKDLLVPGNQQKMKMQDYESYLVRICIEEGTNRIFGTTKLGPFIESENIELTEGETAQILPFHESPLGIKILINQKYMGMIYHNEIFSDVTLGKEITAVVKNIRPDGLVDCALQVQGVKNLTNSSEIILDALERAGGSLPLHDKSKPEEIKNAFGISKQAFKKAIGMLYKEKKIAIKKDGIEIKK